MTSVEMSVGETSKDVYACQNISNVWNLVGHRCVEDVMKETNRGFPTRMVYLYYISCLRYTILVGNP